MKNICPLSLYVGGQLNTYTVLRRNCIYIFLNMRLNLVLNTMVFTYSTRKGRLWVDGNKLVITFLDGTINMIIIYQYKKSVS